MPNAERLIPNPPPDRAHVGTERRNTRTERLHEMDVDECVATIVREDRAVFDAMERAQGAISAFVRAAEPGFTRGGRLIYLGAGTSGRLGVLDASEAPPTFHVEHTRIIGLIAGGDGSLRRSSEGREDDPREFDGQLDALALTADDSVIGIAAGGTTPCVLGALAHVAQLATPPTTPITALLTCSPMDAPVGIDHLIVIDTGAEVITGSTRMKGGTATKLALNTISTTLMVRAGKVHENLMVDLRATNDKLRDRGARIITTLTTLERGGALELLERAHGNVKAAVLMQRGALGFDDAVCALDAHGGRLHDALRAHAD